MEQNSMPTATRVWLALYPTVVVLAATYIAEQSTNMVMTAIVMTLAIAALTLAWRTARPYLRDARTTFDRAVCGYVALALLAHVTYPFTQGVLHITSIASVH